MTILAAMSRVDTAAADVCRWPTAALSVRRNTGQSTRRTAYHGDRERRDSKWNYSWVLLLNIFKRIKMDLDLSLKKRNS